jgi:hypothetical protein
MLDMVSYGKNINGMFCSDRMSGLDSVQMPSNVARSKKDKSALEILLKEKLLPVRYMSMYISHPVSFLPRSF